MNNKTVIADFLNRLRFEIVPTSTRPNTKSHKAIALVTRLPKDIPVGKEIYSSFISDGNHEYLLQVDIKPANPPGWFFVTRHLY